MNILLITKERISLITKYDSLDFFEGNIKLYLEGYKTVNLILSKKESTRIRQEFIDTIKNVNYGNIPQNGTFIIEGDIKIEHLEK